MSEAKKLTLRDDGKLVVDDLMVGRVEEIEWMTDDGFIVEPTITIFLGLAKMAGVHIRLADDPEVERHRGGWAFER